MEYVSRIVIVYTLLCVASSIKRNASEIYPCYVYQASSGTVCWASVPLTYFSTLASTFPLCLPASSSCWPKELQGFHSDVTTSRIRKYYVFCVTFVGAKKCFPEVFKRATSHISWQELSHVFGLISWGDGTAMIGKKPVKIHPRIHFSESLGKVEGTQTKLGLYQQGKKNRYCLLNSSTTINHYSDQQLRASYRKIVGNIFRVN